MVAPDQPHTADTATSLEAFMGEVAAARDPRDLRRVLGRAARHTDDLTARVPLREGELTRLVLTDSEELHVVLIGWPPGQHSAPHDHGGSSCMLRVLRGVATERRYELDDDGFAVEVEADVYLPGSVLECDGDDIHALGCDAGASEPLFTLHVYRPRPAMREHPLRAGVVA